MVTNAEWFCSHVGASVADDQKARGEAAVRARLSASTSLYGPGRAPSPFQARHRPSPLKSHCSIDLRG